MTPSHAWILGGAVLFAFEGALCFAADRIDARWTGADPRRRSHLLGHWLGLHFAAAAGLPLVLWGGTALGAWEADAGAFLAAGTAGGAALVLGLKMIGRDRRALALGFLLTLNPVLWWAGAAYLRRRRAELLPPRRRGAPGWLREFVRLGRLAAAAATAQAGTGLTSPPRGPSARR